RWSAVAIGMCGVLVIAQPSGTVSLIGLGLAVLAACMHGSMFTILRGLKTESPVTITFYFILAGMIIPALFLPWVGRGIGEGEIGAFILIGIAGGLAQLCLSTAYKFAPASLVTPFSYSALIWTIL